jgi:hypothetical protein
MKILSVFIAVGFAALAVTVFFFNPTEPYYPEDDWPPAIVGALTGWPIAGGSRNWDITIKMRRP